MEGSPVSAHRGVKGLHRGRRLTGERQGSKEKEGRRSVDPAFTVSGCHLFTHSTVCVSPARRALPSQKRDACTMLRLFFF